MNQEKTSFKGELLRKTIHISSSAIPIGYYFLDKSTVLYVIVPILITLLIVEILKYRINSLYDLYLKFFKSMLRNHEYDRNLARLNGASWVLISDVICVLVFPKYVAITGMLLLSLSDSVSAIIGRVYGKRYFAPNRSYIGSFTFLILGTLIVILAPKYLNNPVEYILGLITVLITTIADALNLPFDDNFLIPIVSCTVLYALYILFFPPILNITSFKLF